MINSSLSFINEQIFRLLLKISVYERHQLRIQAIYQASFEEAITSLDLVDSKYTLGSFAVGVTNILASGNLTKPFQINLFPQIIDINSSRAQKQKCFEANSTQCSQAVTHPSTD